MKILQREGKEPRHIIDDFLKEFGLQKEDVKYTIVDKGAKGFFSLFKSKKAVVKFHIPEERDILLRFLENLIKKMGVAFESIDCNYSDNYYHLHVIGVNNPGFLIGKEGKMINSIQHLLNRLLENGDDDRNRVNLNVDNYRERHEEQLQNKVRGIVNKVKTRRKSITLEPLSSIDRKVIHKMLESDNDLKTMSIGKGEMKRLVIYPTGEGEAPPSEESRPQRPPRPRRDPNQQRPRREPNQQRPRRPRRESNTSQSTKDNA